MVKQQDYLNSQQMFFIIIPFVICCFIERWAQSHVKSSLKVQFIELDFNKLSIHSDLHLTLLLQFFIKFIYSLHLVVDGFIYYALHLPLLAQYLIQFWPHLVIS